MSCFGRAAAGAVERPTDFKAAMRSLDAERHRAKVLSAALTVQHDYVTQLEDAALCLEKTLSAFPDGDFQLTMVSGLRKKQRVEFDAKMSKLRVDQHVFHEDPTGQHEASQREHRRPSFLEIARKRASAIFNNHAKGKAQIHQRASDRAREQRERLERRLQARLDEARKTELKGQRLSPSLKRAVQKLTRQILAFKYVSKDHVFEKDRVTAVVSGAGDGQKSDEQDLLGRGEEALLARNKRKSELEASGVLDGSNLSSSSIMLPQAGGATVACSGKIVDKAREAGIDMSPSSPHHKGFGSSAADALEARSEAESPCVQLARAFLEANEQLTHLSKLITDDELVTWVVNCNILVLIVLDHMIELNGSLPESIWDMMDDMFHTIKWEFFRGKKELNNARTVPGSSHKDYRAAISLRLTEQPYIPLAREEYANWCGKCMDILHKTFQEKNSRVSRPKRTSILETPSKSDDEATAEKRGDNEVGAFEAFKASQTTRVGQNPTASESDRPLFARINSAREQAIKESKDAADLLYGPDESIPEC